MASEPMPGEDGTESSLDVVHQVLDDLMDVVEGARSMPMSASCVVNRSEVLALLDDLRTRLPEAMDQAQAVLGDRSAVVQDGHREAEQVLADAQQEQQRLVSQAEVSRVAHEQAQQLLDDAHRQADSMRTEVEDYVDGKLANFEIVLGRTLEAVQRGRTKLAGRSDLDDIGEQDGVR